MRIFFINPRFISGFTKSARWFAKSRGRVQRHPDYMCEAVAVSEAGGHECAFLDAAAIDMPIDQAVAVAKSFMPDLCVIYATTPTIISDIDAGARLKDATSAPVCLVGAHVTAETDDTFKRSDGVVDYIARGEYDYTVAELAENLEPAGVKGLSWRNPSGEIRHNDQRAFAENLDALPFPAWRHININDYRDAGKLFPFVTLLGGRGCFGRCTFCLLPQVMYGRQYRTKSAERVLDEIQYDLGLFPDLKEIMFEDDALSFGNVRERLEKICKGFIRRFPGLAWSANFRADVTDYSILKLMKRSGCRMLCVGFEFGSQEILNNVHKGEKIETMRKFASLARRAGIRIHGCFMVGGPGETRETARSTIEFAKNLEVDTVQFSGVCVYPGTEYYTWARDNGCLVPKDWPEWVDPEGEQRAIVSLPNLDVNAINELVDCGLKEFYLRPEQMIRMARNIKNWADIRTKFHGLKSFLDYFTTSARRLTR